MACLKSQKGIIAVRPIEKGKRGGSPVQNLKDAGCDQDAIKKYCQCRDCGDQRGKERLLKQYCRDPLDDIHRTWYRIRLFSRGQLL